MSAPGAPPLCCPYCGEETLEPVGEAAWYCHSCDRSFALRFLGRGRLQDRQWQQSASG